MKVQKAVSNTTKKVQGSMNSMMKAVEANKVSFLALGGAATFALMQFVKSSAIASALTAEFGAILGYVGDIILMNLLPAIEPLLDILWQLTDWFAQSPPWFQTIIALLALISFGFMSLISFIGIFGPAFKAGWALATSTIEAFRKAWSAAVKFVGEGFQNLKIRASMFGIWWKDKFVPGLKNAFSKMSKFFTDTVLPAMKGVFDKLVAGGTWLKTQFVTYIVGPIRSAFTGLTNFFSNTMLPKFSAGFAKLTLLVKTHKSHLLSAALAAGAMFALYMAFTSESPVIRAAFGALAAVLAVLAARAWISAIANYFNIGAMTLGVGVAVALAATLAALAVMFGHKKKIESEEGMSTEPSSYPTSIEGDLGGESIPGFQHGGIVTRPTLAMIGEAGPEIILPLDKARPLGSEVNITIDLSGANITDAAKLRTTLRDATDRMTAELTRRGLIARPY